LAGTNTIGFVAEADIWIVKAAIFAGSATANVIQEHRRVGLET